MIEQTINDAQTIADGGTGMVLAGRYRVIRQLGHGGMGSVWLAEDMQLDNKPFAVKMLPSILVSNKRAYRQLKDEALVAMRLVHPNIVQIRAFEENNGNPFLVMDYIDGQTLDDLLAERGKLSEEEVIRVLRPIAAALDYAHGEGVVHRDVKPANVMIRKDGHPFILDFGIAREIQETLTRVTGKLSSGTLLYMSPEQLNGEQPKPAQDVYSFAAMAYECLKGEPPFVRGAIEDQIKNKLPEPLDTTNSSPKIGEVAGGQRGMTIAASVMAGLAKKPEDRPTTCVGVLKLSAVGQHALGVKSSTAPQPFGARARINSQPSAATPSSYPTGRPSTAATPSSYPVGKSSSVDAPSSSAKRPTPSRIPIASGSYRPRLDIRGKIFLATALLVAAVVGGVLWYKAHLREQSRMAERKAVERRSAERAREDAETAKAAAERGKAVVYAADLWTDATNMLEQAEGDFSTNGFVTACARYEDATEKFKDALDKAQLVIRTKMARKDAEISKGVAEDAKAAAQKGRADEYAADLWTGATNMLEQAQGEFSINRFVIARTHYEEAARKFKDALDKAQKERKADIAAKTAAAEIRIEAVVQKGKIERLSDADGFKAQKDSLADLFTRANALFDEKVKRWGESAQLFTNFVNQGKVLVALDGARQSAIRRRKEAQDAFQKAERDGARTYAVTRWNAAANVWQQAVADFDAMRFASAETTFAFLITQFEFCSKEAKEEHERQMAEVRRRKVEDARERLRRARWRKRGAQFTINGPYGMNLVMKWCPPGKFTMGSPVSEEGRDSDEGKHLVTLTKGFWMGETEVTQGQWKKLMDGETILDLGRKLLQDNNLYRLGGKQQKLRDWYGGKTEYDDPQGVCGDPDDDVPVYHVSWSEAVEFCRKLTQRERKEGRIPDGYEYRLPTEAEWEYACRAGTTTALPNGRDIRILGENNAPALDDIAWYGGNSSVGFEGDGWDTSQWIEKQYDDNGTAAPREVKGKSANRWGLYDMIGNVMEWCDDWYDGYLLGSVVDPIRSSSGASRVIRGGSWRDDARFCRSAYRDRKSPGFRCHYLGFRVALAPSH